MNRVKISFWEMADCRGPEECWIWKYSKNKQGYGLVHRLGFDKYAHRSAYVLKFGAIPEGLWVLHRCDNPSCINPDHLWIGTHQQNMEDMVRKGRAVSGMTVRPERAARGESHRAAKFTEDQIRAIRDSALSSTTLAMVYNVNNGTISRIRSRESWAHVR